MLDVSRTTDTILMVRPYDFGFNEETGLDNQFQKRLELSEREINTRANAEFQAMVDTLRAEGVTVLILEKPEPDAKSIYAKSIYAKSTDATSTDGKKILGKLPDAIFPNNWFSTEHDGTLITYPMAAMNRRHERRPEDVEKLLRANGYKIRNVINVGQLDETDRFLEGTGSMIIDHRAEVVYAARSNRCDEEQFDNFIRLRFYEQGILFNTKSTKGTPIYHTNVMMSIGDKFAVICLDCIHDKAEKKQVQTSLEASFDVIEISMDQMENFFCGNILQVNSAGETPLIVMSNSAFKGFTKEQIERLETHGKILSMDLTTIESVGGGSARCMMAEIFSEKK
jgi:hypothetical protein